MRLYVCMSVRPPANNIGGVSYYFACQANHWLFRKIWLFHTTPRVFPYLCAHNLITRMFWILLACVSPACFSQTFLFCPCMMLDVFTSHHYVCIPTGCNYAMS
jgi:hypothetical protein